MKRYKIPFWSEVASWIAWILPNRVRAWVWISAYDNLDQHYRWICEIEDDDARSYYDAISAIRVENIRRSLFREQLKATYKKEKVK